MKRQTTLAKFGFTKKVKHRNTEIEVKVSEFVEIDKRRIKCNFCPAKFVNEQGYAVHLKCKHGSETKKTSTATLTRENVELTKEIVKEVLDDMVNLACKSTPKVLPSLSDKNNSNNTSRRGQNRREQHPAIRKAEVIHDYEAGVKQDIIAAKYKINRSLVSKWYQEREKIFKCAASEYRKHLKIRPATKYVELYSILKQEFQDARLKGHRVNFGWLWSKTRTIQRRIKNDPIATVRKHVITNFIKRHNVRMRTRQRNRKRSKESFRKDLMKWHATTRERLVRTGKDDHYDVKWGRFQPIQRFNVDQSPLPFVVDTKRTYEIVEPGSRYHKVWIAQPGSGLDKRQCTLQVCFRPNGEQPRIAVIFRGQGKRIAEEERQAWNDNVDVYFQQNAWADTEFSVDWVKRTLAPVVEKESRFVLFCDNLTAQTTDAFKNAVSDLSGVVWYGLPNATDLWQPVDGGFAELLKSLVNQQHSAWLDSDENADKWYNGKITAKERRILITHWVGAAYKKISSPEYESFRWRLFEKTGSLITADGSNDDKIKPENLPDYRVPPPSEYIEPTSNPPEIPACEPEAEPEDIQVVEDVREVPDTEINEEVLVDSNDDRCEDDELVGRKIKALYENGWFIGEMKYFNQKIAKYMVSFSDGSDDYIGVEEIDNVEVILL